MLSVGPGATEDFPFVPTVLRTTGQVVSGKTLKRSFYDSVVSVLTKFTLNFVATMPVTFLVT